jgi:hypothetical protein
LSNIELGDDEREDISIKREVYKAKYVIISMSSDGHCYNTYASISTQAG